MKFPWLLLNLYRRQCAAVTAVEYSLIASGISLTIMFGVFFFGDAVLAIFNTMLEEISDFVDRFMEREDG
jgi:Flp pilus assembly pilin Flp